MKRTLTLLTALLLTLLSGSGFSKDADSVSRLSLEQAFASPPATTRPFVHWYWHIPPTAEKITQDLEAMQAEGIQGARVYPFDVYMKPEWTPLFEHLLKDAGRLGLQIHLNNDCAWSCKKLPWMDHPPSSHSHDVLPKRWKVLLGGAGPGDEPVTNMYRPQVEADRALIPAGSPHVKTLSTLEWPTEEQFATADVILLYQNPKCLSDAGHLMQLDAFLNRGGGLVLSHYVLWNASPALVDLLGLAKGKESRYKHKVITLKLPEPRHPIMLGLPDTFTIADECFWNLQGDRSRVTALATSDEKVGDQISAEPVIWAYERGKGRVVASSLGHFDWTFDDPFFRTILLRGIAWAGGESPYRFDALILRGIPLRE